MGFILGADQLAAAKISHSQAQEWVKLENSENAKSGITKVCIYINNIFDVNKTEMFYFYQGCYKICVNNY